MIKSGLNLKAEAARNSSVNLGGKSFVFTGELKSFSRQEAETMVRSFGGDPVSSVSKKTDFVVAGINPGSKYEKASKLGVKIISEKEFRGMIK